MEAEQVKTLKDLALGAVPKPGKAAEMYLPRCHPMYVALQERDYKEMRDVFRKEHQKKFRSVLRVLRNLAEFGYVPLLRPNVSGRKKH